VRHETQHSHTYHNTLPCIAECAPITAYEFLPAVIFLLYNFAERQHEVYILKIVRDQRKLSIAIGNSLLGLI